MFAFYLFCVSHDFYLFGGALGYYCSFVDRRFGGANVSLRWFPRTTTATSIDPKSTTGQSFSWQFASSLAKRISHVFCSFLVSSSSFWRSQQLGRDYLLATSYPCFSVSFYFSREKSLLKMAFQKGHAVPSDIYGPTANASCCSSIAARTFRGKPRSRSVRFWSYWLWTCSGRFSNPDASLGCADCDGTFRAFCSKHWAR